MFPFPCLTATNSKGNSRLLRKGSVICWTLPPPFIIATEGGKQMDAIGHKNSAGQLITKLNSPPTWKEGAIET